MHELKIYLKSGQVLTVICKEFKFTFDRSNGEYIGYEVKGVQEFGYVGINPRQIAAYTSIDLGVES
ncbi:hypothetical protein [Paenibacillus harenae]|uniref:hypothetical protein n=1 Tax=Paenibacillus harenae TaxID=306543 RepID=UPI00048AA5A5|nr:hypothetical protein [Paenibacillus harenae]